jgi:hypothetical protein
MQDPNDLDDYLRQLSPSKTATVYRLLYVPPEIWMNLSVEAKKLLLN